jgi:hypothetical protein
MPDVQEVFRMATQKVRPDPEALERQHRHQRRHAVNRKAGGYAVVAALVIAGVLIGIITLRSDAPRPGAPTSTSAPDLTPDLPNFSYVRNLNTLDLNTGEMSPLPIRDFGDGVLSYQYAASPDGSQLAYVTLTEDGTRQIFIARIDGTGVRQQVTYDPRGALSPAWSPDGTRIAFQGYGNGNVRNLFVLDVATGESAQVTDGTDHAWEPQFTPNGASLIYTTGDSSPPMVWTVPVTGGESTLLIGPGEGIDDAGNASVSPDGSLVTFLGGGFPESGEGHCGPCRILANADGTHRRVIPGWMAIPAGTWSPDGTRIVTMEFLGELAPKSRQLTPADFYREIILVVDVVTGEATRVARGHGAIWVDDHTLLIET